MSTDNNYKAGYVGVVGLPNSGKSTLVNALVGEKVSIVTAKAQTTRQKINGILSTSDAQYIFVDAPGIVRSESGLNHFLQNEGEEVRNEADVLMVVLNVDCQSAEKIESVIEWVSSAKKKWIAVISKTDLNFEHRCLMIEQKLRELGVESVRISSFKRDKASEERLLSLFRRELPESPAPLFDDELYTTQNLREMSAEIVREKCFLFLKQEIPYGLAVRISSFKEEKIPQIHADILISKENHKSILIGKGGELIRKIGSSARRDIENICGGQVFLKLHVSVKPKWTQNKRMMKELGYTGVQA